MIQSYGSPNMWDFCYFKSNKMFMSEVKGKKKKKKSEGNIFFFNATLRYELY